MAACISAIRRITGFVGWPPLDLPAARLGRCYPARWLIFLLVAYALSPIDLIPDFIPVIGYVDELVLLPLGILLVIRLLPDGLMAELRDQALRTPARRADSRVGLLIVVAVWVACAGVSARMLGIW